MFDGFTLTTIETDEVSQISAQRAHSRLELVPAGKEFPLDLIGKSRVKPSDGNPDHRCSHESPPQSKPMTRCFKEF